MTSTEPPALQVDNLRVYYWTARGPVKAVDDVSFTINRNERFGFIGESGCGKTTTIMAILRLIKKPGRIESGRIVLNGRDLVGLDKEEMRQTRWNKISLIPQGAMNSLNPIMRVRDQIADTIETHKGNVPTAVLRDEINSLLDMVELPANEAMTAAARVRRAAPERTEPQGTRLAIGSSDGRMIELATPVFQQALQPLFQKIRRGGEREPQASLAGRSECGPRSHRHAVPLQKLNGELLAADVCNIGFHPNIEAAVRL